VDFEVWVPSSSKKNFSKIQGGKNPCCLTQILAPLKKPDNFVFSGAGESGKSTIVKQMK
jgi:hypothetical protein